MKPKIWIGIVVVLLLLGGRTLYVRDSATVEQAIVVEEYFKDYCRLHNGYPEYEKVENQFSELYPNREWYYWPNETFSVATFQYPMTLPMSSAPGRSKVSEFFPVIYSYAVYHPCKGLIRETSPPQ
jgi:hypothetical protein